MLPEELHTRLSIVENEVRHLNRTIDDEKEETREHRERINEKLDAIGRTIAVASGIILAATIAVPLLLKAWNIGQ